MATGDMGRDDGGDRNDGGRLALDDPDMRLPWLEPVEPDVDPGLDWSRLARFVGVAVAILLVLGSAAWFAFGAVSSPEKGDGSIIAAPDTPYKVRPENPGGKRFAGRDDTSYMIGEGIEREGRIAREDAEKPQTEATPDPAPGASPTPDPTPDPTPEPAASGVAVQVGAYARRKDADEGWRALTGRYTPLSGYNHRVVEGRADIGTVFRLQAMTGNRDAAQALCRDLRDNGIECQVKR